MKTRHIELFKELSQACGVSGYAYETASIFIREAERMGFICSMDALGSVSASLPSKINNTRKPKDNILITAHLDNVGYIVLKKDSNSFELKLGKVGLPMLEGDYRGVVVTKSGRQNVVIFDEGEEETYFAKAVMEDFSKFDLVNVGDVVFYDNVVQNKPSGKFTGAFMDNKASILCMLMAMEQVVEKGTNFHNLFFVLTNFEETGAYGAITAACKIKPFFSITLDVFPVESKRELSCGVVINDGPIYNPLLVDFAKRVAEEGKIPHKVMVPDPDGESDAFYIIWQNGGTPVCEIGTPSTHVHVPDEIVSKKGLVSTARLLAAMCLRTGEVTRLVPGGNNGL